MKKSIILQSFICLLAMSCTVRELDIISPPGEDVFYASLESYSESDTRVYLDDQIKILWDAADRISIFNKSTLNQQYEFKGDQGTNSGVFGRVPNGYFGAGNDLDYIYAVYPYLESTNISNSGVMTLNLPAEQTYRENSFGPGANTMVSVTDDKMLRFKNVGGYLGLKFYAKDGKDVYVSSISLTGHSREKLSGKATMTPALDATPVIEMAEETDGSSIVLNCEPAVKLGASADEPTIFWMVVPPTDFAEGFSVTITAPNGDAFIQETSKHLTIERNKVMRISAVPVDFDSEGLKLNDILPVNEKPSLMTDVDEANRTITVTMPTITDFSDLLFDYDFVGKGEGGSGVMVNGENIEFDVNGIPTTHINASRKMDEDGFHLASVVVRNGKYGKNYTLKARNTGLPVVRIMTKVLADGSNGFDLDYLESFKNLLQSREINAADTFDHRVWLPEADNAFVKIRIEYPDGTPGMKNNSGVPVYELNTKIKGRGNYTWKWDKKPYALKFDKKGEVLGMPAHKRWILLANWRDRTLLRNDAAFWLSKQTGLPYTVNGQFVELEFNGEHRGNYYLCEQIKIDENRVNITPLDEGAGFDDMTGGYLMEIDSYWDEVNKFKSNYFKFKYMFKEPDEDPAALEAAGNSVLANQYRTAFTTMKTFINRFERVLKTKSAVVVDEGHGEYNDYLDVDSAIWFMLLNEMTGNRDFFQGPPHNGPHSTYLYKDKKKNGVESKLFMGPGWDFDYETFIPAIYYGNSGYKWRGFDNHGNYYYFLCANQSFVDRVKELWALKKDVFLGLTTQTTGYIDKMADKIRLSQQFDDKLWPYDFDSSHWVDGHDYRSDNHDWVENGEVVPFQTAIDRMKSSFNSKVDWMDGTIKSLTKTNPSGSYYNGRWYAGEWQYP